MAKGTTRRINIYINGKEVENNVSSIRSAMAKLIAEQNKMTIGSDKYISHTKKIQELRGIISEHNAQLRDTSKSWQGLSSKLLQFGAGFGGFSQMFTDFRQGISSLKQMAIDLAALDDIYADVIKYTGLTRKEVVELNEEFKKMDTRTAREELNRLAGEGGKIGLKTQEDIKSFVEAANIIQISLGEDLGEGAVKQIAKLTKMFGETDKHGLRAAMLKVGSTINEVAQNSTAAEPYLLEFTNRLSGIGNQAGLTIDQIIGFGSVLDQNAQTLELSSTAMNKFVVNLSKKTETVARAAGVPVKELKDLVGKDMNAAILRVFESLNKKGGLNDLAPLFKDLGADGSRAAQVITTLAGKYQDIITEQELAKKAYQDGTSVLNEYNTKNNNMQAELEKAKKKFQDVRLELGEKLYPVVLKLTKSGASGLKVLSELVKFLTENKGLVFTLTSVLGVYLGKLLLVNTALKAKNIWTKASSNLLDLQTLKLYYNGLAHDVATKKINIFRASQEALRITMMKLPWGAILTVITAIGVGIYKLATHTTEAEKAMKEFNKQNAEQQAKAKLLFDQLQNLTKGTKEYNRVQKEILETYPDILQNQVDEHGNLKDLKIAYDLVTQSIEKQLAVKVKNELLEETTTKHLEKQRDILTSIRSFLEKKIGTENAALAQKLIKDLVDQGKNSQTIISELEKTFGIKKTDWITEQISGWKSYSENRQAFIDALILDTKELNKEIEEVNKQFAPFINDRAANEIERLQLEISKRQNRLDFPGFKPVSEEEKSRLTQEILTFYGQLRSLTMQQQGINSGDDNNNDPDPDKKKQKAWDAFYKKIEDIRAKYLIKEELDYSKEAQSVKKEFETLIREAEAFAKKHPGYSKKIGDIIKELQESEKKALEAIDKKILDKDAEKRAKRLERLAEIQKEITSKVEEIKGIIGDDVYNKYAKELMQASQYWDKIFKDIDRNILYYSKKVKEEYDPLRGTGLSPEEMEAYEGLLKQKENAITMSSEQQLFIVKKAEKEVTEALMTEKEKRKAAVIEEYKGRIQIAQTAITTLENLDSDANAEKIAKLENQIKKLQKLLLKSIDEIEQDIPDQGIGALFNIDWDNINKDWKSNLRRLADAVQEFANSAISILSSLDEVQNNKEQTELNQFKKGQDERLKALQSRYDQGLISEAYYNAEVEKINKGTDLKEKELQLEQWRRNKRTATIDAAIQGSLAAVKTLAQFGFPFGLIPMAASLAVTAAQIAAIQSQPEPFFMGGYVKKRTVFQAGEKGPEWVASNQLLQDKKTSGIISELEKYQRGLPSVFDTISVSVPNTKTVSQAADTISRNFVSNNSPVIHNYYTNSTDNGEIREGRLEKLMEEVAIFCKLMSDPNNRKAVISRDIQKEFENQETFLRDRIIMKR